VTTVRLVVAGVRSADPSVVGARLLRSALAASVRTELYVDDRVVLGADEHRLDELVCTTDDVLVYHHGGPTPEIVERVALHPGPIVVILHRSLPTVDHLLRELAQRADLTIAPTAQLGTELADLGCERVELARIMPTRFATLTPDPATLDELAWRMPSGFVLAVDAILPSARHDIVLQAVHLLQHVHGRSTGIVVAGASHDSELTSCLYDLVAGLHVDHAWFADRFDERALAAVHQRATLAITFGEVDGETLADVRESGLPLITCGATHGARQPVLPRSVGPAVLAEAMLLALDDDRIRERLTVELTVESSADEVPEPVSLNALADMVLGLG
jgi:hypothetical protein